MAIMDPPKCLYCGEYHFNNLCPKRVSEALEYTYICVVCELPIFKNETLIGMGSGTDEYLKQKFAHEVCYHRKRAKVAEVELEELQEILSDGELLEMVRKRNESGELEILLNEHGFPEFNPVPTSLRDRANTMLAIYTITLAREKELEEDIKVMTSTIADLEYRCYRAEESKGNDENS